MAQIAQLEVWAQAVHHGDKLAVGKLLAAYHPILRARAEERLARELRAQYAPEDVLQQVYLQVIRCADAFRGATADAFLNWVLTILDHQLASIYRNAHRQVRDLDRELPAAVSLDSSSHWNLLEQLYAETGTASRIVRQNEAFCAMLHCLDSLSDSQRQVLQWRFLEGHSVEQVADRLHTTKPAVVALTRRALDALRRSMDRIGDFTHGG